MWCGVPRRARRGCGRAQVTDPSSVTEVGEWEEWTGTRGASRRRALTCLPVRHALARKVFGDQDFDSEQEVREAEAVFGAWAVFCARLRKRLQAACGTVGSR